MPPSLRRRVEILEEKMVTLEALRDEMRAEFSTVRKELRAHGDEFVALRKDISGLGMQMRVLHEDVIERISRLKG